MSTEASIDQTVVLPSIAAEIFEDEQAPGIGHRGTAKLGGAVFWSYVLTSGGTLVNAALQIGLTVILSPNDFGVMVVAMVFVTLALQLLAHGPSQAVVQADGMTDEHFNAAFWVTMLGALIYTLLFVGLSPLWASANHVHNLVPVCWALSPVILLHAARAIPDSVMLRRMEIRPMAVRNLIAALVGGLVGVGMAVAGLGVWALVGQQLTTFALSAIILWSISPWRPHRPNLRSIRVHMRDMRSYSLQTLSGSLGFFISDKVDGLLMGLFLPVHALGLYRFASRFPDMTSSITSGGVATVSLPEFARHNADRRRMAEQLTHLIRIATMLTFPTLAILAAVATPFVHLIGHKWEGSEGVLEAMCLLYMVMTIDQLLAPALQAAERPGVATAFTWIGAVLSVVGFLAAIHWTQGEPGTHRIIVVALAVCAEHVVLVASLAYITFYRILKVSIWPTVGALIPATLAAGVGFVAGRWLADRTAASPSFESLVISGAGGGIAAIVLLLILERAARSLAVKLLRKLPGVKKLPGIRYRTVAEPVVATGRVEFRGPVARISAPDPNATVVISAIRAVPRSHPNGANPGYAAPPLPPRRAAPRVPPSYAVPRVPPGGVVPSRLIPADADPATTRRMAAIPADMDPNATIRMTAVPPGAVPPGAVPPATGIPAGTDPNATVRIPPRRAPQVPPQVPPHVPPRGVPAPRTPRPPNPDANATVRMTLPATGGDPATARPATAMPRTAMPATATPTTTARAGAYPTGVRPAVAPDPRWLAAPVRQRPSGIEAARRMARSALLRTAVDETARTATRSALILAPHPDDETLGCGVTILRKVAAGTEVTIAVVSDGRHSHTSDALSPGALAALRRGEMAEAAWRLGVPVESIHWGGFFDTTLDENYPHVVEFVRRLVTAFRPDEIYATCADEPHPDHAAVGRAARQVVAEAPYPIRLFEYPIWLWSRWPLRSGDRLGSSFAAVRQVLRRKAVKIKSDGYVQAKLYALAAHASQLGRPDMVSPDVDWPGLPTSHIADAADKAELFLTPRITGKHR